MKEIQLPKISNSHLLKFYNNAITSTRLIVFQFKLFNYYFNYENKSFTAFDFMINATYKQIHKNFIYGLSETESDYQTKLNGECDLNFEVDTAFQLLYKEFSDPFYLFQVSNTNYGTFH